jgi:hypothetical protein
MCPSLVPGSAWGTITPNATGVTRNSSARTRGSTRTPNCLPGPIRRSGDQAIEKELDADARDGKYRRCQRTTDALAAALRAGALDGLMPTVLDYVPGYRTSAGTGAGMAFARWL